MTDLPNAGSPDLNDTCWTCAPLEKYVGLTGDFVGRLGDTLHDPMLILYLSLSGLWIVISGTKLHFNMTSYHKIIEDLVYISITGILLGSLGGGLITSVYTSAIDIMGAASSAVFDLAGHNESTDYTGLTALAASGERAVAKVIQAAMAIADAGSAMSPQYYLYALILALPYVLLVITFACQVVVAIFRATLVGVFAPFLFMAFAFGWGRGMAQSGAKTLLASILVLFALTAALSLTIYGVTSADLVDPAALTGERVADFASISNPKFLVVLFLGWAGIALTTEGTSIANSIAGTALTNAAAGVMTAGITGSGLSAAGKGIPGVGNALSAYSRAFFWGKQAMGDPGAAAKELVDKFKNINKPGGGA